MDHLEYKMSNCAHCKFSEPEAMMCMGKAVSVSAQLTCVRKVSCILPQKEFFHPLQ